MKQTYKARFVSDGPD